MAVQPVPAIPAYLPFPGLTEKAAGTYNAAAYAWANQMPAYTAAIKAVADNTHDNAGLAETAASAASDSASSASGSATAASASAASAINAPGTSATSTSSVTVGSGVKNFTLIQLGKLLTPGQRAVAARTSNPAGVRMVGYVLSNDPATGAFSMDVGASDFKGSGTYADWTIGMAGEGSNIPAPTGGDVGKVLGVVTGGSYALVPSRGAGAGTTAPNTTIASSAISIQSITPTSYGQWVKLPDATTLSAGTGVYTLRNPGAYDLAIQDNAGTVLGYLRGGATAIAGLADASTAAGVWVLTGAQQVGSLSAELATGGTFGPLAVREVVELDSTRELIILASAAGTLAVVWDALNSAFGPVATVRSHNGDLRVRAIKSATNQVLVVSCDNSTALQAVTLSITSNTTITVNSAVTAGSPSAALAAPDSLTPYGDLIAVAGQGFAYSYVAGTTTAIRALTVTGTAPAWGAEVTTSGSFSTAFNQPLFDMGSSRIAYINSSGSTIYCNVYTMSGTTLTAGTTANFAGGTNFNFFAAKLASGRIGVVASNSGSSLFVGAVFALAGTVASVTTATLFNGLHFLGAAKVIGNSIIVAAQSNGGLAVNVLTDASGTATAGTAITRSGLASASTGAVDVVRAGSDASSLSIIWGEGATALARNVWRLGISGNNPVLLGSSVTALGTPGTGGTGTQPSYPTLGAVPYFTVGRNETNAPMLERPGSGGALYLHGTAQGAQVSPVAYQVTGGAVLEVCPRPSIGVNRNALYARDRQDVLWACGPNLSGGAAVSLTKLRIA